MLQKMLGPVLVAGGVLIIAVSLLANVIGRFPIGQSLGLGHDPGFGTQQTIGTIVGAAVFIVGIWVWRQRAQAKFATVRFVIAALAVLTMIGGPIFLAANRGLRQSAVVEVCVEVQSVPTSAGGAGQKRVNYGVRITNIGKPRVYLDSVVLLALRNSAGSWLPESEVAPINDIQVPGTQVDSMAFKAGSPDSWSLSAGNETMPMRSIIVPVEQLRPLYSFRGIVFFRHLDPRRPRVGYSAVDWIDNFPTKCPLKDLTSASVPSGPPFRI
jgi:hypothetical protein